MAARQDIATAASTVAGVTCSPYFRQTSKAGDAMVRLARQDRDTSGFGFMTTWQVLVVLPSDLVAAEKFIESKAPLLTAAVGDHLVITSLYRERFELDTATVAFLVIEGARETD